MIQFLKNGSRLTGFWLAITTVLFVVGWRLCVIAGQHHLLAIATEVGSIPQFRAQLFPNGVGTSLVFSRETETGLGTYFCQTASGKSKLLFEQKEKGFNSQSEMLAWSPDDRVFACAVLLDPNPMHPQSAIILYDGVSGEPIAKIGSTGYIWLTKFIWMSPNSFAYQTYNQVWLVFDKKSDDNWVQTRVIKKFADGELKNLTVTSPHSLAWQQGDDVWTYDFVSEASEKMWGSATNKLDSFTYSEETENFALNCHDENGPLSIYFRPPRLWVKQGAVLGITRNDTRARYADLRIDHGRYSFAIKTSANSDTTHFVWDGMVEYYQLAGGYLYFAGNQANETPGIWRYDIHSNDVRHLISNQDNDFRYTTIVTPLVKSCTDAFGNQISYHLWAPRHISPGRKYPLIIGQTHYMWSPYQQVAPNAGYYFATVDRATWVYDVDNWREDVVGLYDTLVKTPNIDTNRIFLAASSTEARDAIQVLAAKPDICKGLILFNPSAEPDLSQTHLSKMFIVGGRDDTVGNTVEQLTKYQDEAAKAGVPVKLYIQDGVQHVARSVATERERTRQFARFLLEN
jgi:hypothetical protein